MSLAELSGNNIAMKILSRIETSISYALLALMIIVVISATVELAYTIVIDLLQPPGFLLGISELLELFGLFLMILIGMELVSSIQLFMEDHIFHVEAILLVALTAVARKIVILDPAEADPFMLLAMSALIVSLVGGYYFINRSQTNNQDK